MRAEIIDKLIQENDSLKKSTRPSPAQSPRARAAQSPRTAAAKPTPEQPSGRSATVKSLVSQQEATLSHVVDRVEAFRRAEQELLKEKTTLVDQVQSLSEQVGADEARIVEAQQQTKAAQTELANKAAEFAAAQAEWDDTQRAVTEKHGSVLQKYAQKKQALHAANEEAAKHAARADELAAKLAGLERSVKVLEGQKEEDAQKYKDLVVEVEQRQRTLDVHATRGLSKDKEWQSRHETLRKEAEQREAMLLRKQGELQKALEVRTLFLQAYFQQFAYSLYTFCIADDKRVGGQAEQHEHQRLSTVLSQAEAEVNRLRAECNKLSEAAGGASSEAQLRMLQRMDRENKAYNASVVQKTVEVLGHIIERTGSITSPLAVLPAASDGAYRTGPNLRHILRYMPLF